MSDPAKPVESLPSPSLATVEHAKKFLEDDDVRLQSRERKIEFLKTKGLRNSQIVELLGPEDAADTPSIACLPSPCCRMLPPLHLTVPCLTTRKPESQPEPQETSQQDVPLEAVPSPKPAVSSSPEADRPPIVTYPEFLTTPAKPPPLLTASGVLHTLAGLAGLSSLIYGAGHLVVAPLAEALTDARADYFAAVQRNLDDLVSMLETAAGPADATALAPKRSRAPTGGRDGGGDDLPDLTRRDLDVQTSLPPNPAPAGLFEPRRDVGVGGTIQAEAKRITEWADLVGGGEHGALTAPDRGVYEVQTAVDELMELVTELSSKNTTASGVSYAGFGARGQNEPDDEIKRAKDIILTIKGGLLNTKTFPLSTR